MHLKRVITVSMLLSLITGFSSKAQVAINTNGSSPDASSMLDITSTTKGVLIPRMTTTQRGNISSPANGLIVYDVTTATFWYRNTSAWVELLGANDDLGNHTATQNMELGSNYISNDGTSEGISINSFGEITVTSTNNSASVDIEVDNGNTPTIRLAQNKSASYTAQNWDLSGNEVNFFIKDATSNKLPFKIQKGAANNALVIDGSGEVGIGTSSPLDKLHVNGSIRMVDGAQSNGFLATSDANGTMSWTNPNTISLGTHIATQNIELAGNWLSNDGGDEGVFVSASGAVGINTSSLSNNAFYVNADNSAFSIPNNSSSGTGAIVAAQLTGNSGKAPQLRFFEIGQSNIWNIGMNDASDFAISYGSGASEKVLINSSGDFGIGESDPDARLHIKDNFAQAGQFVAVIENTNGGGYANGLLIKAGQNTQTVNNRFISFARPDGTEIGSVRQTSSSGVGFNTTSDIRLKTNIVTTNYGLENLLQIDVMDYHYKADTTAIQTGFIAQQLNEHFPEAVSEGGEDALADPWMVDYGKVTPLLVKAVQEQQEQIEALKMENEKLKIQVARINALEAMLLKMQASN